MMTERRKSDRRVEIERRSGIDRRTDIHYAVQWLESDERRNWNLLDRRKGKRRVASRRTGAHRDTIFRKIAKKLSFFTNF